jgi:hypothetical protein
MALQSFAVNTFSTFSKVGRIRTHDFRLDVGRSASAQLGHLNLSVAIYLRKPVNTSPVLMQGILKGEVSLCP